MFESERSATTALRGTEGRDKHDQQLGRILAAATRVMAREGYDRASMRSISRETGVSLAGLYHYIENKEQMLFLVQFHAFSALLTEVQARLCGEEDPVEQLRTLIRTHVLFVADNMAALKVCSHELDSLMGENYDRVRRVRREYYELARSIVGRIIEERAPASSQDRRAATMCLFGTLNWLYRWYDPDGERSPASLAHQIFAQFLAGMLGAAQMGRGHAPVGPAGNTRPAARRATGRTG